MKNLFLIAVALNPLFAMAANLDQFLGDVREKHRSFLASKESILAAEDRFAQADLALSPVLTFKTGYSDDRSLQQNVPTFVISHQKTREYTLGLGKQFSSGTNVQVTASSMELFIDALTPAPISDQRAIGNLGVSMQQSLWKNSFGNATRLRWDREEYQRQLEKESYSLQGQQILIEAESSFWDLLYLQEEQKQRAGSLERAKTIESWIQKRVGNGIGDRADFLNAKGLVAVRELQTLTTADELLAAQKKVADILELGSLADLPKLEGNFRAVRSLESFVGGARSGKNVVRLDSYLAVLESEAKKVGAAETEDSMRPDLSFEAAYRNNAYQATGQEVISHLSDSDRPTSYVGLKLTWLLDGGTKGSVVQAARKDALAANLKSQRKMLESESSWLEIKRRHNELSRKIEAASKMSQIQSEKAKAERDRLNRGRTVTSQVVTAEQDAAEAELTLIKMQAEQRKLEAQARLFIRVDTESKK